MMAKHIRNLTILCLAFIPVFGTGCRKGEYKLDVEETVSDNGAGTGTVTWTRDKAYLLKGLVFVNDGQTLTIEAGTVIRGRPGQGTAASALIVARGGRIIAEGTPADPIIFTSEDDDLSGSVPVRARGLWGGVIILGSAGLNSEYHENAIEGIPISEPRSIYGGNNDEDNSGILRYVSIRHGGTNIGENNEINGLTLGGVGSGTIIEHVEVISNADDGFEFFGGTISCKYLLAAFCGDDAFDYDEGYRGKGQFWAGIKDNRESDHLLEASGGIFPENGHPLSTPELYNLTLIGSGTDGTLVAFDRNAGGTLSNSIMVNQEEGVSIEFKEGLEDSYQQFENGNLQLSGNVFFDVAGNESTGIFHVISNNAGIDLNSQNTAVKEYFSAASNKVEFPGIIYSEGIYQLVPQDYIFSGFVPYTDDWFDNVSYQGAFGTFNWASGWTLISQQEILYD